MFSKCFHKSTIASGPPQSCHATCLYPGECGGMSCATSRPRSGPGRVCFRLATTVFPLHPWLIMGQEKLPPRSHSAESLEEQQVSTLVCHTCGWDTGNPKTAHKGPPRGLKQKCLETRKLILSVFIRLKSRPALLNHATPLACTLGSVGVCHARPQGPGRARAGPVSDLLPWRFPFIPGS